MTTAISLPDSCYVDAKEARRKLRASIEAKDGEGIAESLLALYRLSPERWRVELAKTAILPHPNGGKRHFELAKALVTAHGLLVGPAKEAADFVEVWVDFNARYRMFQRAFDELDFWEDPPAVQVWRLCAYIESQHRLALGQIAAEVQATGTFDPYSVLRSTVPAISGEAQASIQDAIETQADTLDLILRRLLRTSSFTGERQRFQKRSPYEEEGFARLFGYAMYWESLDYLWQGVLYYGWKSRRNKAGLFLSPSDPASFLRSAALAQRESLYAAELQGAVLSDTGLEPAKAAEEKLREQMTLPEPGEVWDGALDPVLLRSLVEAAQQDMLVIEHVEERHYQTLIRTLKIPSKGSSLDWSTWQTARSFLHAVGEILQEVVSLRVDSPTGKEGCFAAVLLTRRQSLTRLLAKTVDWEESIADAAIEALVFNPERGKLDIYVQPLIPVGEELVFLVPALMTLGSPSRAIETLAKEHIQEILIDRGPAYEDTLAATIQAVLHVPVAKRLKIEAGSGDLLEIDVLFVWDGELFLVESKCLQSIEDPYDEFRAARAIEGAVEQLLRRRVLIRENWDCIRASEPRFPDVFPERVHLICATNLLQFSGQMAGEVLITDDLAFFRYFRSNKLHLLSWSLEHPAHVHDKRELYPETRSPAAFRRYLVELPQFASLIEGSVLKTSRLPALTEVHGLIEFPRVEFHASATGPLTPAPSVQES